MAKFVPRERKHKRRDRPKHDIVQSNVQEIIPPTSVEQAQRRRQLQEELRPAQPTINAQKRKRLDKYIETKLKKEENLELLKKLAAQKVDTTLLQSAKKLGRVTETKRERFRRALAEKQAGIDVDGEQETILFERRPDVIDLEDVESQADLQEVEEQTSPDGIGAAHGFGAGLKRPLEADENGRPLIKKRKRRGPRKSLLSVPNTDGVAEIQSPSISEADYDGDEASESPEWNGFSEAEEDDFKASYDSEPSDAETSASSVPDDDEQNDKPARVSAFKAWADTQRNESLGFTPSVAHTSDTAMKAVFRPRTLSPDADNVVPASAPLPQTFYRPSESITIPRAEDIQSARLELPVVREEQKIMEAVHNSPVVVVCGATGSGKTTQVPQMLLENGYASKGMIGVTQPRRVAATSVASRVAYELGGEFGRQVGHQVRYDSHVGRDTSIKFMTDGILLRELSQDFVLSKYSAIVIDEAHERSINTDILIGMLSRIVPLRQELSLEQPDKYFPLKLIIMSATLRITDFVMNDRLFKGEKPPIVQAEGRQYPVTDHFARRTQRDYVEETVHKVSRGHRKLPPGSMLVFLTGQDEIQTVAKRLRTNFSTELAKPGTATLKGRTRESRTSDFLERHDKEESDSDGEIVGLDESDTEADEFTVTDHHDAPAQRQGVLQAHIVPLYASLPASQQNKVFEPPPDGTRMIVLATNVAETSLTIPGIRYVFDCGRSKEKRYDPSTGVQEFAIDWISKASASQRRGRAGRTGPGHCYRLYSSAIYEQYFEEHTVPEVLRSPIEGTVLQLKNLEVDNVINFPFPTPPDRQRLANAEGLLKTLGALEAGTGKITATGKELIQFPVNPRFGKILLLGLRNGVLQHTIALVAGLAVGDLFIAQPRAEANAGIDGVSDSEDYEERQKMKTMGLAAQTDAEKRRQAYGRAYARLSQWDDRADIVRLLTAIAAHASADVSTSFCAEYFLREKGMSEAQQLRRQLHFIAENQMKGESLTSFVATLPIPKSKEIALLKQIVAAGYIDHVAIRTDLLPSAVIGTRKARRAIEVAYRTLHPSNIDVDHSATPEEQEERKNVYVHPSSVLSRLSVAEMPPYIIYSELSRATATAVGARQKRVRIHPLTTVGPKQLAALAEGTQLLDLGKPMGKIEESEVGKKRTCWAPIALKNPGSAGSVGWPLGAWKVVQARKGKEWVVEKVVSRGS